MFANLAIYVVTLLLIGLGSLTFWIIYLTVAFIPVFIIANQQFKEISQNVSNLTTAQNQPQVNAHSKSAPKDLHFQETTLARFDDENIDQLLSSLNLKTADYFFAVMMPNMGLYFLAGALASLNTTSYLVAFNPEAIYLFELSRLSGKKIVNCNVLTWSDLKLKRKSSFMGMAYRLKMEINGKKVLLQTNKKIRNLNHQKTSVEKFINLL